MFTITSLTEHFMREKKGKGANRTICALTRTALVFTVLFLELLGRFEPPDVRRFAADIRRMIESALGGRSAVQISISERNKGRPGVLIYFNLEPAINKLNTAQRGQLFTAILEYGHYGYLPNFDDPLIEMAWAFVQDAIDRDGESYAETVRENKIAGLTSAFKRHYAPKHGIDPDDEDALQTYIRQRLLSDVDNRQPNTNTNTDSTPTTETTTTPIPTANPETAEIKEIRGGKPNELSFEDMCRNGINILANHLRSGV